MAASRAIFSSGRRARRLTTVLSRRLGGGRPPADAGVEKTNIMTNAKIQNFIGLLDQADRELDPPIEGLGGVALALEQGAPCLDGALR